MWSPLKKRNVFANLGKMWSPLKTECVCKFRYNVVTSENNGMCFANLGVMWSPLKTTECVLQILV
jgi:hypothetical protein